MNHYSVVLFTIFVMYPVLHKAFMRNVEVDPSYATWGRPVDIEYSYSCIGLFQNEYMSLYPLFLRQISFRKFCPWERSLTKNRQCSCRAYFSVARHFKNSNENFAQNHCNKDDMALKTLRNMTVYTNICILLR